MKTRTTFELDDQILQQAYDLMPELTKRSIIELALTEFIQKRKQKDIRELFGKGMIDENYDYKAMRAGKIS